MEKCETCKIVKSCKIVKHGKPVIPPVVDAAATAMEYARSHGNCNLATPADYFVVFGHFGWEWNTFTFFRNIWTKGLHTVDQS